MFKYHDDSFLNHITDKTWFGPALVQRRPGILQTCLLAGLLALAGLYPSGRLAAHGDIDLQIEQVSAEISSRLGDAGLYLKRAELHRFHQDWRAAATDYQQVRQLAPAYPRLDFFEARYLLEVGKATEALLLITRFIEQNSRHPAALVVRAGAYELENQCGKAAADLGAAINLSDSAGPELYLRQANNLLAAGCGDSVAASRVLDEAIAAVGPVVALVQLATSVNLSLGQSHNTLELLDHLPDGMISLPQWRYRRALALCLDSQVQATQRELQALLNGLREEPETRRQRWQEIKESAEHLLDQPYLQSKLCRASAKQLLPDTSKPRSGAN